MKFKVKAWKKAMDAVQYGVPDDAEIEIVVRTEDFEQNKICDCFTLIVTYAEKASSYDSNKNSTDVTHTLEMYPESENRSPRVITTKVRNI